MIELNTFSITARCKTTGQFGVAVSTARPAVGSLAPYAKANVGAIATQALVNPYFGIDGLTLLGEGLSAEETLKRILSEDDGRERRQVAIVDLNGNTAAFTGKETVPWQGHLEGEQFVVAGNMLTGPKTLDAMHKSFTETEGKSSLAERLLAVLEQGQQAGGDKRGKQSAALYIVDQEEYPLIDIRVDEHENPVPELRRVYDVCQNDLFPYTSQMVRRHAREES